MVANAENRQAGMQAVQVMIEEWYFSIAQSLFEFCDPDNSNNGGCSPALLRKSSKLQSKWENLLSGSLATIKAS